MITTITVVSIDTERERKTCHDFMASRLACKRNNNNKIIVTIIITKMITTEE